MENLKKLKITYENLKNLYNKEKENHDKYFANEINHEIFTKNYREIEEQDKIERIKKEILKNNLAIEVKELFIAEIFEDLQKYNNKNIGEKTKEKIQKEICEKIKNILGLNVSCYFKFNGYRESYSINFYFNLLNEQNTTLYCDNSNFLDIYICFKRKQDAQYNKMDFDKTMLESDLTSILRENEKAIDLQDLEEHAIKIYNSKVAIDNKIEEYKKELEKMIEEHKQDIYNNLYNYKFITEFQDIKLY